MLREEPMHTSAVRPPQIKGCDREMFILMAFVSAGIAALGGSWVWIGVGALLWVASSFVLVRMGKADPMMRQVLYRHLRYRVFYPAKAGIYSPGVPNPKRWR